MKLVFVELIKFNDDYQHGRAFTRSWPLKTDMKDPIFNLKDNLNDILIDECNRAWGNGWDGVKVFNLDQSEYEFKK